MFGIGYLSYVIPFDSTLGLGISKSSYFSSIV